MFSAVLLPAEVVKRGSSRAVLGASCTIRIRGATVGTPHDAVGVGRLLAAVSVAWAAGVVLVVRHPLLLGVPVAFPPVAEVRAVVRLVVAALVGVVVGWRVATRGSPRPIRPVPAHAPPCVVAGVAGGATVTVGVLRGVTA